MRKINMLAASLCLALVGLVPLTMTPASADTGAACQESSEYQTATLGVSGEMSSCFYRLYHVTSTGSTVYKIRTRLTTRLRWPAIYGCVKVQLFNASGELVGESPTQRFSAANLKTNTSDWSGSISTPAPWTHAQFDQYQC